MWIRCLRWFLITAPVVAGILLLIFGTAGAISTAFGVSLIGIAAIVWMWNWFIRMSFDDHGRDDETREREQRAHRPPPQPPSPPHHPPQKLGRRPRRPT